MIRTFVYETKRLQSVAITHVSGPIIHVSNKLVNAARLFAYLNLLKSCSVWSDEIYHLGPATSLVCYGQMFMFGEEVSNKRRIGRPVVDDADTNTVQ